MALRSHYHVVYDITYYLVLVTKYRRKCINKAMLDDLREMFGRKMEENDMEMIEFNGESDHIHILFKAHPSVNISTLINNLKTTTSRLIRKKYAEHLKPFYWKPVFWKRGYCIVSTGGASLDIVKRYIEESQDSPD